MTPEAEMRAVCDDAYLDLVEQTYRKLYGPTSLVDLYVVIDALRKERKRANDAIALMQEWAAMMEAGK